MKGGYASEFLIDVCRAKEITKNSIIVFFLTANDEPELTFALIKVLNLCTIFRKLGHKKDTSELEIIQDRTMVRNDKK